MANPFRRSSVMAPTLGADEGGGYVPGGHEESWVKDRGDKAHVQAESVSALFDPAVSAAASNRGSSEIDRRAARIEDDDRQERVDDGTRSGRSRSPAPVQAQAQSQSVQADPFESISDDQDGSAPNDENRRPDGTLHERPTMPGGAGRGGPSNPFRISAGSQRKRDSTTIPETPTSRPKLVTRHDSARSRASLDVDAFKRLIMSGAAGSMPPAHGKSPAPQLSFPNATPLGDNGSSTDGSSISRHSIFESVPEGLGDTPRTSHELSISEDERQLLGDGSGHGVDRQRPPPPTPRHGKPVKGRAAEVSISLTPPTLDWRKPAASELSGARSDGVPMSPLRPSTNLNKPLPSPPSSSVPKAESVRSNYRASMNRSDTNPLSTSPSRRTPPEPPLSRRHSHLSTRSTRSRHGSNEAPLQRQRAMASTDIAEAPAGPVEASPVKTAPRPPPARRPGADRARSSSTASHVSGEQSQAPAFSSASVPEDAVIDSPSPTPATDASLHRASSITSSPLRRRSSGHQGPGTTPGRSSTMGPPPPPPPPPPRRHRGLSRGSVDSTLSSNSQAPGGGGEAGRARQEVGKDDVTSVPSAAGDATPGKGDAGTKPPSLNDAMADLTALQQEVDALRGEFARRITN